jgi:pyruvate kinase
MLRHRKAKIVATVGPASNSLEQIRKLHKAGVDVFRLNFSHGSHEGHKKVFDLIRQVENEENSPISILADLQGPKIRIGTFEKDQIHLAHQQIFRFDLTPEPGNNERVYLPHPEIFASLKTGEILLLDDGKIRLQVIQVSPDIITTTVITGGLLSNRKGLNVPGVSLPISALTKKDKKDLEYALSLGVDWIALSFVQRPEDIEEARNIIQERAFIITKLEKPLALNHLSEIITLSDGIMVARGDLGVEMSPEDVPSIQKRVIRNCREAGKPVIVATQMLESMISSPAPTRAEASDVATAIYDGVDAVMLSAESASGNYPLEAVTMMNRIISQVEQDSYHQKLMTLSQPSPRHTINDAVTAAARQVAQTIPIKAIVTFTESGSTTLNEARERPEALIVGLTPKLNVARMLALVWGTFPILSPKIHSFKDMVETAHTLVLDKNVVQDGDLMIILAGVPFGSSSGTNIMRIVKINPAKEIL